MKATKRRQQQQKNEYRCLNRIFIVIAKAIHLNLTVVISHRFINVLQYNPLLILLLGFGTSEIHWGAYRKSTIPEVKINKKLWFSVFDLWVNGLCVCVRIWTLCCCCCRRHHQVSFPFMRPNYSRTENFSDCGILHLFHLSNTNYKQIYYVCQRLPLLTVYRL